jgi:hypothetical protein
MNVQSARQSMLLEDGIIQFSFDLTDSDAEYLIISTPADGNSDEFFGADHYVEVKDQLYGIYGGLARLAVLNECALAVELSKDVPGVGREILIKTATPMPPELLHHLRQLERS